MIATAGALAATALALTACSGGGGDQPSDEPKTLTLGIVAGQNLIAAGEGLLVWQGIYDSLLRLESDGSITPGLAEEWEYSDDGTTLTLHLREGVTFSDGDDFDAEAAKASLEYNLAGGLANGAYTGLPISAVKAPDDSTLVLTLSAPDPSLEVNLATGFGAMIDPDVLQDPELKTKPIGGTGAYELDLKKTDPSTQYVLERRDDEYWDADRWTYDEIVLKVMPDQAARINALRAGEIDGTAVTAQAYDEVDGAGMSMISTPGGTLGFGLFDRDGVVQPALADVRVRQAIGYAFDREEMLASIQLGHGELSSQIFPNVTPVDGIEYDYDPEKAKKLLAEAGYADGFELTGVDLGTGNPLYAVITDRLAAIGISMTWVPVSPAEALTAMFSPKYPVLNTIWDGTGLGNEPYTTATGFFSPQGLWNMFKNENPELSVLLDNLAHSEAGKEREAAYAELDGWVTTNAWLIPVYRQDFLYATSTDVTAESAAGNATPFLWSFQPAD